MRNENIEFQFQIVVNSPADGDVADVELLGEPAEALGRVGVKLGLQVTQEGVGPLEIVTGTAGLSLNAFMGFFSFWRRCTVLTSTSTIRAISTWAIPASSKSDICWRFRSCADIFRRTEKVRTSI